MVAAPQGTPIFDQVKVGDTIKPIVLPPISRHQLALYCGGSGDHNPIHVDLDFAKKFGFKDVFAHGMLSMGFVAQAVSDWAGAGRVRKLGVRFAALVRLKDTVTCRGRVVATSQKDGVNLVELDIWAENGKGEKVVAGKATVALPARD
jgi:acyl dehydratase